MLTAECEGAVRAQSLLSTTCTSPRVDIDYRLGASSDAEASARFALAMELLETRLPALLTALARVERIDDAGSALTAARGLTEGIEMGLSEALEGGDLRAVFGLTCAAKEARKVADLVNVEAGRLYVSAKEASMLVEAIGLQN